MIERKDLYHIPFYKKSDFTGSYYNMHYRLSKQTISAKSDEQDDQTILRAWVWPGPYCFDATSDEKKESEDFEFSNDGITDACEWLNQRYQTSYI